MVTTLALITSLAAVAAAAPLEERAVKTALPSYIASNLGPYSPWAAAGTYQDAPAGCTIDMVNILQRHGQRYPTANAGKKISASVAKLQAATSLTGDLTFVKNYKYALSADNLTPGGAAEAYQSGQEAYNRYQALYPPFVRTDSSQRVVDSAGNWTQGYYVRRRERNPPAALIINNAAGSNDTLDDNNCDSAPDLSDYEDTWLSIYAANATARLNADAPGANLKDSDTLNIMQLCGFDTEYFGTLSPFCGLFTEAEWEGMEYYYDLDKWYGTGYGQPLGRIQGVGYGAELLSRLTGNRRWVQADETTVNHTLSNHPATFPLDAKLYADFSHDNQITPIIAAIGLKNGPALPATGPPAGQSWVTSQIVPFSGRLVVERLQCSNGANVRFFINDQLQIPTFCAGADSNTGLCPLSAYVASQEYTRNNGNGEYAQCGYTPLA
ncbi:hypothetical protein JCM10207_008954 [Rhodosporidiobolus poonsookiae]